MPNSELSTFPSSKIEALTMLFLQNQDLSNLSPEEIMDKYQEAYDKIRERNKEMRSERQSNSGWTV